MMSKANGAHTLAGSNKLHAGCCLCSAWALHKPLTWMPHPACRQVGLSICWLPVSLCQSCYRRHSVPGSLHHFGLAEWGLRGLRGQMLAPTADLTRR